MKLPIALFSALFLFLFIQVQANHPPQPVELGKVHWLRSMPEAVAFSQQKEKPIFILFQEVPGCSTCRNYGNNVLSHPLIVEAIETLFVPLAIHNNKQGEDARILKYFGEPSWNNPVVRIVNADKKDIISRVNGNYSQWGLVQAMIQALNLSGQVVPRYLELLAEELQAEVLGTEEATFSMYCFWTGEGTYGNIDGVLATEPGFMDGREVVKIQYNPSIVSYETLLEKGQEAKCASKAYTNNSSHEASAKQILGQNSVGKTKNFRPDSEPKYYLSRTTYKYIPMTALQAAKANSFVGKNRSPKEILSPRQLELYNFIKANPKLAWSNMIGKDIQSAWAQIEKIRA